MLCLVPLRFSSSRGLIFVSNQRENFTSKRESFASSTVKVNFLVSLNSICLIALEKIFALLLTALTMKPSKLYLRKSLRNVRTSCLNESRFYASASTKKRKLLENGKVPIFFFLFSCMSRIEKLRNFCNLLLAILERRQKLHKRWNRRRR